jgi:hypothetical protein
MVGQVFNRAMLAEVLLGVDARRWGTAQIARPHRLIKGTLVEVLYALLNGPVLNDHEAPGLAITAVGGTRAGLDYLADKFVRHRIGLQPTHGPGAMDNLEQVSTVCHGVLLLEDKTCHNGIS